MARTNTDTSGRLLFNLISGQEDFPTEPSLTSDPDSNIFPAELHCHITGCFSVCPCFVQNHQQRRFLFVCFKLHSSKWRMGVASSYLPSNPPPPAKPTAGSGGAFVLLCWRKCIVCPSAPPLPPSLFTSITVWPEKTHGRCGVGGGTGEAGEPAERRRGVRRGGASLLRTRHCACVKVRALAPLFVEGRQLYIDVLILVF